MDTKKELVTHLDECLERYGNLLSMQNNKSNIKNADFQYEVFTSKLDTKITKCIKEFCKENKIEIEILILDLWIVLWQRYSNRDGLILGFSDEEISGYKNIIPVCVEEYGDKSFYDSIVYIKTLLKFTRENLNYCSKKFNESGLMIENLLNHIVEVDILEDEEQNTSNLGDKFKNFDLFISFKVGNSVEIKFIYNKEEYYEDFIKRVNKNLKNVFLEVIKNPNVNIDELDIVSKEEKNKILSSFNNTSCEYEKYKTLNQIFEEQVANCPNNLAVMFGDESITYCELNNRVNQLARVLRLNGIGPNKIVGVFMERSIELAIALISILKAGGAYLPIMPNMPKSRIDYMIEQGNVNVVLLHSATKGKAVFDCKTIDVEDKSIENENKENLDIINNYRDLAYVIYTSGSTGKPKGVMIEHFSVVNRLNWMQKKYPLSENDVILQKTPYAFDVSVWELFWWFFNGAKVCFLNPNREKNPIAIIDSIKKNNVTVMHFVPSMLSLFSEYIENCEKTADVASLRQVFCSGEALTTNQVKHFYNVLYKNNKTKLANLYGPTEGTVDVSYFDCMMNDEIKDIPIGKPIDNIQLYIVNDKDKLQPIGAVGEIYISGDGLARGYLDKDQLTKEKFVENPFIQGNKMYKTGDLGRWLSNGDIEYLGRVDNQVKIHGIRIELGEIEKVITEYYDIKNCVVVNKKYGVNVNILVAYIVANNEISTKALKCYLKDYLPEYMIPSKFILLDNIPLNLNGKIDIKSLPDPF